MVGNNYAQFTIAMVFAAATILLTASLATAGDDLPLDGGDSVWRFADVRTGIEAVTRRDSFTNSLSPFDRQVRLKTDQEVADATVLQNMADQVLPWDDDERKLLSACTITRKLRP